MPKYFLISWRSTMNYLSNGRDKIRSYPADRVFNTEALLIMCSRNQATRTSLKYFDFAL